MRKILTIGALAAGVALAGGVALAVAAERGPGGFGPGMHTQGMGPQGMAGGPMGMHGANASEAQAMHDLFTDTEGVTRTVTSLDNGIRTVIESDDPKIAQTIKDRVAATVKRAGERRDAGLPVAVETKVETTNKGVVVTQTSADATAVAMLQMHAGQAGDRAVLGMRALHDAMAINGARHAGMAGGMMDRMHGPGQGPAGTMPMMHGGPAAPATPPAETRR